ncbi:unnamed protein product [Haemonchus placei]|uniref:Uncharacterized protein n=1 Tax=Haemonchus placei TaxID=6290 RepID=A0A0N4WTB2_HAEPC|nr:unnamed protein product [Haemonchus placei]
MTTTPSTYPAISRWFKRRYVDVFDWSSPHLNPIKHLRNELECRMKGKEQGIRPKNLISLKKPGGRLRSPTLILNQLRCHEDVRPLSMGLQQSSSSAHLLLSRYIGFRRFL